MTGEEWQRVKELCGTALDLQPPDRARFLDKACAGNQTLRLEVESLLQSHAQAGSFIETPARLEPGMLVGGDVDPNIGRVLGPYRIEKRIGSGGMGTVYLASRVDREFERRVAIKMVRRGMDSELVIRRFRHERQILASLDHPNIASLFDGGTTPDGLPYFVMEYVDGVPIDRYADGHKLTTVDRLRLCLGVLDAVQHAHDRQIVHRDLKPSNVIVTAKGHPKLLDFGIAKILDLQSDGASTFTSVARPMTPDYASPEQVRGGPVTPATDVYALGLLLYELLTGHRPYRLTSRTHDEMARVVCEQDPDRPSAAIDRVETTTRADGTVETTDAATVSEMRDGSPQLLRKRLNGALDDIVLKALRKEPDRRYPNASALADDIRRYLAEEPISAGRGAWQYGAKRFARRHRIALGAAALVVVAVGMTALVATTVMSNRSRGAESAPAVEMSLARASSRPSLAVIGFRNLSGQSADQWLSTAMAEMLTTELAGDGQVRVLPAELVARARRDLGADAEATPSRALIDRLRGALAADHLVLGSFAVTEQEGVRSLRLDVRAYGASDDPMAVAAGGDQAQLFAVVAAAGRDLRRRLGLKESPPEATNGARAAFPTTVAAMKLYAEGIARLRLLDAVAARDLLAEAESIEPANPMIQTALSSAWTALGYDGKAETAAQKAHDVSSGLNREDRLNVEGRLYEAERQWPQAVEVYRTLWGFFSDNIEYGLRLAAAETAAGRAKDALTTVADIRTTPAPQNQDPRIDIQEAQAASALGDFPNELAALRRALQAAEQSGMRVLVARARLFEGRSLYNQGKPAEAEQSLDAARRVFLEVGDRAGVASALNSLGSVLGDQQDLSRSERMYKESLATSEEIGDRRAMSAALNNLGVLLKDQRRFVEARQAHEQSLAIRREIGDRNWTAVSLSNIGVVLFEQDRFREAAKYYRESLTISREIGDRRGQVRALHNLAIVDREVGNLSAARKGYEESLVTRAEIGDTRGGAMGRVELGMVLLAQGELEAAQKMEEDALQLAGEAKLKPGEAQALFQLGEIALAAGDLGAARRHHEHSLLLRRELGETRTVPESQTALAALAFEEGREADAEGEARAVVASLGADSTGPLRITLELLIARARLAVRDVEGATRALQTARRLAENTERIDMRQSLIVTEAELDAVRGRTAQARARLSELRTTLARSGMTLRELECRLAVLRLDRAAGLPTVDADTSALVNDARARRAGLIVRRAQAL